LVTLQAPQNQCCEAERYDGIGFAGPFHPEVTLQAPQNQCCEAERYDGIGFAGPFHPEVTLQAKTKNAAWAAFNVFYTTGLCQQAVNATCIKY
jgi:hypothetical protein